MPSPPIPRSKSAPNITKTPNSPPCKTSHSVDDDDSISEPLPTVLSDFMSRKDISSSKNLEIIEESFKQFNKQNEILDDKGCNYSSSPYYKGLTDFSLDINRHKISSATSYRESSYSVSPYYKGLTDFSLDISRQKHPSTTPGRDISTDAASFAGTNSKSSVIIDKNTSCFPFKTKGEKSASSSSASSTLRNKSPDGKSNFSTTTTIMTTDVELEVREVNVSSKKHDESTVLLNNGKALGEKISKPRQPSQPRVAQVATASASRRKSYKKSSLLPENPFPGKSMSVKETRITEDEIYVWADKYRPSSLKDFLCNRSKALELQTMAKSEHCCHFIFEGLPGVGKRTMIWALLREIHGADNLQAREECKEFYLKGEEVRSIYVNVKVSAKHIEVNLSELRGYEKHVIVQLINEKSNMSPENHVQCNHENCKAIILYGADKLSSDAMIYIKWLLDRYKGCNKVFFCCSDASKLEPVKPICKVVQLLQPSVDEIVEVLEFIAEMERIELPHQLAVKIASNSKKNLRQAIRSFEATWHANSSLKEEQEILTGWEDDIAHIARNIIEEQSPKQLYHIRGKLQNLIEHNVSPEFIFQMLVDEIKKNVKMELHEQIEKLYGKYNKKDEEQSKTDHDPVRKNVKQFMKIEEFIAKFMSWYKSLTEKEKGIRLDPS